MRIQKMTNLRQIRKTKREVATMMNMDHTTIMTTKMRKMILIQRTKRKNTRVMKIKTMMKRITTRMKIMMMNMMMKKKIMKMKIMKKKKKMTMKMGKTTTRRIITMNIRRMTKIVVKMKRPIPIPLT